MDKLSFLIIKKESLLTRALKNVIIEKIVDFV